MEKIKEILKLSNQLIEISNKQNQQNENIIEVINNASKKLDKYKNNLEECEKIKIQFSEKIEKMYLDCDKEKEKYENKIKKLLENGWNKPKPKKDGKSKKKRRSKKIK
jgi:hypothetical protein